MSFDFLWIGLVWERAKFCFGNVLKMYFHQRSWRQFVTPTSHYSQPWSQPTLTAPMSQGSEHRDLGMKTVWPSGSLLRTNLLGLTPQITSSRSTNYSGESGAVNEKGRRCIEIFNIKILHQNNFSWTWSLEFELLIPFSNDLEYVEIRRCIPMNN